MWLDVALMDRRSPELTLEDDVRGGKSGTQVALFEHDLSGHVGWSAIDRIAAGTTE